MKYTAFIKAAMAEDSRNVFGILTDSGPVPSAMTDFYLLCNPIDVEISYPELGAVRFCPRDELSSLSSEYELGNGAFVFASCNGDPLFLMNGEVYTTLHGIFKPEFVASSFDEFLDKYVRSQT